MIELGTARCVPPISLPTRQLKIRLVMSASFRSEVRHHGKSTEFRPSPFGGKVQWKAAITINSTKMTNAICQSSLVRSSGEGGNS